MEGGTHGVIQERRVGWEVTGGGNRIMGGEKGKGGGSYGGGIGRQKDRSGEVNRWPAVELLVLVRAVYLRVCLSVCV